MVVAVAVVGLALLVGGGWLVVVALAGRSASPARERVPVHRWSLADLAANGRAGATHLADLQVTARPSR